MTVRRSLRGPGSWLLAVLVLAGLAWGGQRLLSPALASCGWLDRALGRSGCLKRLPVADFSPMLWQTMVLPDPQPGAGPVLSLFGQVATADGWRSGMVRLALDSGEEQGRHQLALLRGDIMSIAADRERVGLACPVSREACVEGGGTVMIASARNGRLLGVPKEERGYDFPGEAPSPARARGGVVMPGSGIVVEPLMRPAMRLTIRQPDGQLLHEIALGGANGSWNSRMQLFPSPEGRLVALLETTAPPVSGVGSRLRVWDVATGRLVAERSTSRGHALQRSLAWLPGEEQVAVLHAARRSGMAWVEIFSVADPARSARR